MSQGQIWHKYLSLATFAYNIFNSPNLCNHSPYELVFGRKLKILLDKETNLDIKISGTYKEYFTLLNKRLQYFQNLLQNFRMKCLALINNHKFFQYNSGDMVNIISPLTSQLRNASRKIAIKYVGPIVIYKIVDPHYLLMTLDGKLLQGVFEHERLKLVIIRTDKGNVTNLAALKKVMTLGLA